MQYMCLFHYDEQKLESMPKPEYDALMEEGLEVYAHYQKSGNAVVGAQLQSVKATTTIRPGPRGMVVTDGPFAETKEQLGGFVLIKARDLNEAIQIASKLPPARLGCVEVRPIKE